MKLLVREPTLHVFNVGQGDCMLLRTPSGKRVLIDTGPDTSVLSHLTRVLPAFDRSIDLLVLTHGDRDHSGGLRSVLERIAVASILIHPEDLSLPGVSDLLLGKGIAVLHPDPNVDIDLGGSTVLDVVWPPTEKDIASRNDRSIALRILTPKSTALLTGDIEQNAEHQILRSGADISADLLKVAHHGSKTSSATGFLLAIDATESAISAGYKNRFGHPHEEVIKRLEFLGIPVQRTFSGSLTYQLVD